MAAYFCCELKRRPERKRVCDSRRDPSEDLENIAFLRSRDAKTRTGQPDRGNGLSRGAEQGDGNAPNPRIRLLVARRPAASPNTGKVLSQLFGIHERLGTELFEGATK